ncbi:hypothetical protein [Nonomuraea pusilla]|uniref:Neocarzinostatin family protein n=1 Tax=Nonomuraea pusilla TaxID=46177 RepID=A0A1H8CZE8_9ACTN|nr:hypothetical protein [Nonomuraea pusilla]SEN00400.1 hypothetical protein SAMN05660976_06602 [Nonomuraea pusilla]
MKRISTLLSTSLATLAVAALPAQAVNPHFLSVTGQISGTNLIVSFKEAGLGNNQNIDYTASANSTATYVCVNRGGKNPSAQNKETVSGPVSATGTFNSGNNGQVTASLAILPPSPGAFSCPPGQSLELARVTYSNVQLSDDTNGIVIAFQQTFDTGCLLPNVKGAC